MSDLTDILGPDGSPVGDGPDQRPRGRSGAAQVIWGENTLSGSQVIWGESVWSNQVIWGESSATPTCRPRATSARANRRTLTDADRLPPKAQAYVILIWIAGAARRPGGTRLFRRCGAALRALGDLGLLALLGALAGRTKVRLTPRTVPEDIGSLSLSFALIFADPAPLRPGGGDAGRRA